MGKKEIKEKIKEAIEHDPHKNDIERVLLFGSYLHGDFKNESDIDLIVEFTPNARIGFFNLARIKRNFEKFTNKEVDLLTPDALSEYFREEVMQEAEKIYEKR